MKSPHDEINLITSQGISINDIEKYWIPIYKHMDLLGKDKTTIVDDIYALFSVSKTTVRKKLKNYLNFYREHIPKILGFYPEVDTIIDLAILNHGEMTKTNLFEINMACKAIVDSITKPRHEEYIRQSMDDRHALNGTLVNIELDELTGFLYDDYSDFVTAVDNGRVSIAGRNNEEIFLKALVLGGLQRDKEFSRTGTDSEADIHIRHTGKTHKALYCEVKSYKARERFLRGLRDIPSEEKIGIGFFLDAAEFNPKRTRTLLAAQPKAIYLPDKTYNELHQDSKESKTTEQNKLYRKLSMFVDDMVYYVENGCLPGFK